MSAPSKQQPQSQPQPQRPEEIGFGKLFHIVREAIVVLDATTRHIVLWNPAAEELFGYSSEEAIGQPVEVFAPTRLHDDLRTAIDAHADSWLKDQPLYERQALHRSGREIWIEYTATPVIWQDETYIITFVRDCTERKILEAHRDSMLAAAHELARSNAELAEMKSDFTAMVAHELGSPLATIRMLVDLIDRPELSDANRQHALGTIRAEAGILQRLAEDIQGMRTLERDDFSVHPAPIPVSKLLDEATASAQHRLASHDFRVAPAPDVRVMADASRIGQVLRNLLDNASRHTPPGTQVELRADREDGRVRFTVRDSGPGIDPDELTRILDKYSRGRSASDRAVPGMGLGLYLSRLIVQAHHSMLAVSSVPGASTTIAFSLREVSDG